MVEFRPVDASLDTRVTASGWSVLLPIVIVAILLLSGTSVATVTSDFPDQRPHNSTTDINDSSTETNLGSPPQNLSTTVGVRPSGGLSLFNCSGDGGCP